MRVSVNLRAIVAWTQIPNSNRDTVVVNPAVACPFQESPMLYKLFATCVLIVSLPVIFIVELIEIWKD